MENSDNFYDRILSGGPSSNTFYLVLSRLKDEGRLTRVIQECIRALEIYPGDIHIRRLLAESYFETGRISQAEAELGRTITRIEELIPAYRLQAELYSLQKRNEEAAAALELYLAHRPEDHEARDLLSALKVEETPPVAEPEPREEAISEEMEESDEPLPEIATPTLAEIYHDQGQIEEAIETYEKVLLRNPEDERSRERLEELKRAVEEEGRAAQESDNRDRQKKERMITVLESWLSNIQAKCGETAKNL
jgi:tetratricopeptide (TPR) repeat protein